MPLDSKDSHYFIRVKEEDNHFKLNYACSSSDYDKGPEFAAKYHVKAFHFHEDSLTLITTLIPLNEEQMVLISANLGPDQRKHGFKPLLRLPVMTDCFLLMSERLVIWNVNYGTNTSPWKYFIIDYSPLLEERLDQSKLALEDLSDGTMTTDNFSFFPEDEGCVELFVKDRFWLSITYDEDTSER